MIRLKNISYSYVHDNSHLAIKNLSLDIREGEFLAVVGRNGSGKSTFTRLLNGLLLPDQGKVEVDGLDTADLQNLSIIRRKVGLLLPVPDNQLVSNVVEEDVAFGPENLGLPADEIRRRVDAALKMVSMEDYVKHPPYLLSGGQKQKICIAGILAMKPKYMVLDEPAAMLDPQGRREIMETLLHLQESEGISLIIVTNCLEEIVRADRIVILDEGEIKAECPAKQILPKHDFLIEMGIEPLETTTLIHLLNETCGLKISEDILDIDELVEEICRSV